MRKLCLIVVSLWAVCFDLTAFSIDLYGMGAWKSDLKNWGDGDSQKIELDDAVGGVKISVPCVDGRFYWNGKDFSYGAAFNSAYLNKTFPVQAKWGKLSVGGGLSKLNNPLLSSAVSPFSSATSAINPITASLSSSFNKSDTFFFQAGYKHNSKSEIGRGILQSAMLNCYYDSNGDLFSKDGNVAVSSIVSFDLPNKMKLSAECTFGSFVNAGLKSDSWYSEKPFYHKERLNSAVGQVLFSMDKFSSIFTGGFYGSPFGGVKSIYKIENKIKFGKSVVGISLLYNPSHNLITSSGKIIDECVQGKLSLQHQFRNGKKFPIFWKTGVAGYYNRNLTLDEDDLKLSAGLQMLCFITSVTISAQGEFCVLSPAGSVISSPGGQSGGAIQFTKGTVTLKNQWYFQAVQPGVKLSVSFTPSSDYLSWKTSENCVLYLSFCENPVVSIQSGVTFNQKDEKQTSTKVEVSGTVKFNWKWVRCTGKVGIEFTS